MSEARLAAMRDAIRADQPAKVRLLLKAGVPADGACEGAPFVQLAASLARDEIFSILADAGADLARPGLLAWACDGGGGRLAPSEAIVRRLLAAAPPPPDVATAALRFACVARGAALVPLLVAAGADPDGRDPKTGDLPLSLALEHGRGDTVSALLVAGASADATVWDEAAGEHVSLAGHARRAGHPELAALVDPT